MDGILIIDKPYGMTSHDVVNWLRKKYKQKKKTPKTTRGLFKPLKR